MLYEGSKYEEHDGEELNKQFSEEELNKQFASALILCDCVYSFCIICYQMK